MPSANTNEIFETCTKEQSDATARQQFQLTSTPLERLFDRHYARWPEALARFHSHLARANIDFDVDGQISEQEFPPQGDMSKGMPSCISYYVPGTGFGTNTKVPTNPTVSTHNRTGDGIGLNRGCPIRLAHAFEALFALKPEDQVEPLAMLRARTSHLHAVEELLWLTLWKAQREVSRGGSLVKATEGSEPKNIDWFFISGDTPIFLEAKFRPTDWIRAIDQVDYPISEKLFRDIGSKFSKEQFRLQRCGAGITGFAEPNDDFFASCEDKLASNKGLDVILYRSLLGPVYVCSLNDEIVKEVSSLIRFPEAGDYPSCYPLLFNRPYQEQRRSASPMHRKAEKGLVFFSIVPLNEPNTSFSSTTPYRYEIAKWNSVGKPKLTYVPYS